MFANLVLADEINRAPAKVQSALLEAMAEGQVSIGGTTYALPKPFLVLATQNPIESEGVYQLPEAQRDRFLMKVDVGYPDESEELAILQRMSVNPPNGREVLDHRAGAELQQAADRVFVHHAVAQYAVALVMATREPARRGLEAVARHVEFGASPTRHPGAGRGGAGAGPAARARLRAAARRRRRRQRRPLAPARALLRRDRRGRRPAADRRLPGVGHPAATDRPARRAIRVRRAPREPARREVTGRLPARPSRPSS